MTDDPTEPIAAPDPEEPIIGVVAPVEDGELPDLGSLDELAAELDSVERALARLDEGTYGTCEACGTEIPDEVLATRPAARRCTEHAA